MPSPAPHHQRPARPARHRWCLHIHAYDSRLKGWMRRFHGVATKDLESYLGWHRMLERHNDAITPSLCLDEA